VLGLAVIACMASAVLAASAIPKILDPNSTTTALQRAGLPASRQLGRGVGVVELVVAIACSFLNTPTGALLQGLLYVAFSWFLLRLKHRSSGPASCGCFGQQATVVGRLHIGINLSFATLTLAYPVFSFDSYRSPATAILTSSDALLLIAVTGIGALTMMTVLKYFDAAFHRWRSGEDDSAMPSWRWYGAREGVL